MSTGPFARNPDLKRLRDEGYSVEINGSHLVMRDVPYVTANRRVERGVLVAPVTFAGGGVSGMNDHTVHFQGAAPSDSMGQPLAHLTQNPIDQEVYPGLRVNFYFSQKPVTGAYQDNYEKFTSYVRLLSVHATQVDSEATARLYRPAPDVEDESPFLYRDSASSRAGIDVANQVFRGHRVAIVGLGAPGRTSWIWSRRRPWMRFTFSTVTSSSTTTHSGLPALHPSRCWRHGRRRLIT